ncbi:MAG: histidine--tRNA ligase [Bacteroidetes bacterium]|nr:histidine--tRNA ligase [Bacteroidota bacterium]
MIKPTLPQGTRDFPPQTLRKRQYVLQTIREVFERSGFQPLETPAMENLDTLLGKYGEEGDKLIFRILNNGLDNPGKHDQAMAGFHQVLEGQNSRAVTERALRYDLTIPFARFVAMNHGQLSFPFKRYQMQPVWRADKPQKGRYREFWQCDADVVGSPSLLYEAELSEIYLEAFRRLGIAVQIRINHRHILAALAEACGGGRLTDITAAIDKLDKVGLEKVMEELARKGFDDAQCSIIRQYLSIEGDNEEKLTATAALLGTHAKEGLTDLRWLLTFLRRPDGSDPLTIDLTLARGLDYYTGMIFEVKALEAVMGSIGGGGRYDDLTGLFGVPGIPGIGISFGVDRICDVIEEKGMFPPSIAAGPAVLFFHLGEAEARQAWQLLLALRQQGTACEMYPEAARFDKQFKYAERRHIPCVAFLGAEEIAEQTVRLKTLATGEQETLSRDAFLQRFARP